MSEYTPKLTLDNEVSAAPAAPIISAAPAASAAPLVAAASETAASVLENVSLSPEEQKQIDEFAGKIDITDSALVMQYGSGAQKNIADFSSMALENVRTKDLGAIGDSLTELVGELRGFNEEADKKGVFGIFRSTAKKLNTLRARYAKTEANVDKIVGELDNHRVVLLKDIAMLDRMYDLNLAYFKELTMYILAGKKKLAEVRANEIPQLEAKAKASGLPEDAQAFNDMVSMADRFEKCLYDLELTRNISIQTAPQIRLIQNNDALMSQKIQTSIVNTIPLWKQQMVLALSLEHSRQAMEAQRAVTDLTNEMLLRNAETLKTGTVETAKESERGIVEIETLQKTNQSLIETIDEMIAIQNDGRAKRAAAEIELGKIENDLKTKLLEIRGR